VYDLIHQGWAYLADHPALLVIWCAVVVGLVVLLQRVNAR
jgi:hypothetical protein